MSEAVAAPVRIGVVVPTASATTLLGAVTLGAVVSRTVTVCVSAALLPELSVAVHVIVVSPSGKLAGASLVTVTEESTVSEAVAAPVRIGVVVPAASAVMSAGAVTLGAVVSRTVTVWVSVAELPASSVAVQVTVVLPSGNDAGASLVTVGLESRSSRTVAEPSCEEDSGVRVAVASNVLSAGAVIVGGEVSGGTVTVIVNSVRSVRELAVAVTVTLCCPTCEAVVGLARSVPLPLPMSTSVTKLGFPEIDSEIASPFGSDALTCRVAVVPRFSEKLAMSDMTGGPSVLPDTVMSSTIISSARLFISATSLTRKSVLVR